MEKIAAYAAIISALSAFINTGFVIWLSSFRKTRMEMVDDLKFEIRVLLSARADSQMHPSEYHRVFESLGRKYQKKIQKVALVCLQGINSFTPIFL